MSFLALAKWTGRDSAWPSAEYDVDVKVNAKMMMVMLLRSLREDCNGIDNDDMMMMVMLRSLREDCNGIEYLGMR